MDIAQKARVFLASLTDEQSKLLAEMLSAYATEENTVQQKDLDTRIRETLLELGVPAKLKGYKCLRLAIKIAYERPEVMEGKITKELYPSVAKALGTTGSRVERAIRHAIEVAYDRGDLGAYDKYFGSSISPAKGKAENSEFISAVVDYLKA